MRSGSDSRGAAAADRLQTIAVASGKGGVGKSTVSLNLSGASISVTDDPGRIVLVVRNPGPAILTPASDIFVSSDYQSVPPSTPGGSFAASNPFLFWIALLGGIAFMLPALQHTVPALFRKRRTKIGEEE